MQALPIAQRIPCIHALKNYITTEVKNYPQVSVILQALFPVEIDDFMGHYGDRIIPLIKDAKSLSSVFDELSDAQIGVFIHALGKSICTLIPDINTLCDVCKKIKATRPELKNLLIEILYPFLVTTEENHQALALNLLDQAALLNKLKQNLVSRLGYTQRLQMLDEPKYCFEWNDAENRLTNLRRLFTLDQLKHFSSPLYEKILGNISQFESVENSLEQIQALIVFFEKELLEINEKTQLASSSKKPSFFAAFQTPLEKSDVVLRMQFALKKLEEKQLELLPAGEEIPFNPAAVTLMP